MRLKDRVAVVTGAGAGIGRAVSLSLARRGCHLSLCDINEAGLRELERQASALGVRCSVQCLDVTDRSAVAELPGKVMAAHGGVHLLINNAGVALGGRFEEVSEADFDWLMDINFHAVVRMTRAFLPHLRRMEQGRIVNVSSLWGLMSPPGQAAYSASKFAVRGFSNALRHELDGSTVSVAVVHPGGVATSIARSARTPAGMSANEVALGKKQAEALLRMKPAQAGEIIVNGIERDLPRILVGSDARLFAWVERVMPVKYWRLVGGLVKA